jgi:hypothetical protein
LASGAQETPVTEVRKGGVIGEEKLPENLITTKTVRASDKVNYV